MNRYDPEMTQQLTRSLFLHDNITDVTHRGPKDLEIIQNKTERNNESEGQAKLKWASRWQKRNCCQTFCRSFAKLSVDHGRNGLELAEPELK